MKILLLAGGTSAEREISLLSGRNVSVALQQRGHVVTWLDPADVNLAHAPLPACDVVFIALHGTFGEDGQVQTVLEQRGLPYTGSGPLASYSAFYKTAAKRLFQQQGVRTPPGCLFQAETPASQIHAEIAVFGFPLFVKPVAQGSSIGVTCVTAESELFSAMQQALQFDESGLIEPAIAGLEYTLGIFDEVTLPLVHVRPAQPFYDYHAKYHDAGTELQIGPDLPWESQQELIQQGRAAYQAVGARGLARIDMMLDSQQRAWVLEVNTLPGLTSQSSIPRAALHQGWSLGELCEKMCQAALQRTAVRAA